MGKNNLENKLKTLSYHPLAHSRRWARGVEKCSWRQVLTREGKELFRREKNKKTRWFREQREINNAMPCVIQHSDSEPLSHPCLMMLASWPDTMARAALAMSTYLPRARPARAEPCRHGPPPASRMAPLSLGLTPSTRSSFLCQGRLRLVLWCGFISP